MKKKETSTGGVWTINVILILVLIGTCCWKMCVDKQKEEIEGTAMTTSDQTTTDETNPYFNSVTVTCGDNYTLLLNYYSPDLDKPMSNLSVTAFDNGVKTDYEMIVATSGSGARYTTVDNEYELWEHQGVFELSHGETVIATCTDAVEN